MAKYTKWIFGGLGFAIGGPIGAIVGYLIGVVFENVSLDEIKQLQGQSGGFMVSLLILTAAVIKADRKIMQQELDYVRNFFKTNFGEEAANTHMRILHALMNYNYSLDEVTSQMREFLDYPARLQILHYLFGIASSDGKVDSTEVDMINRIARGLEINSRDFESIKAMFFKDNSRAYKILEIPENATDDEVKKAYRKMAVKYHPDKVAHLGEEVRKAAEQKFQMVVEAYEIIKKERGFN